MAKDDSNKKRPIRQGDILPLSDFEDLARERLDFDLGADAQVDPAEVPSGLQHLIPLVRRWALPGSARQLLFIEHLEQNAPQEITAFRQAVAPHRDEILDWIRQTNHLGHDAPDWISHFSYMLSAYELTNPPNASLIEATRAKNAAAQQREQKTSDITASNDAMRNRNFVEVVRLLEPYESELSETDRKRLEIARKRI